MAKNKCIQCSVDSGNNRICDACYRASFASCSECGRAKPTITTLGKPSKSTACVSCTTKLNANTRRIGITCKVCGKRTHDFHRAYQMCAKCISITVQCPICNKPMPKYRKRGMLRKVCSSRCAKIAHPTTHEQAKKAQKTKWAGHVYKSHQNTIARKKSEYIEWRKTVFERDNYTCKKCGIRNGNGVGRSVILHPHHIKPFATHPDLRYEPSNGVTFCESCHRKEHSHVFIGRTKKTNLADASSCNSDNAQPSQDQTSFLF